ncbi:MAG TPA: NAD(P)/FAD-dependent oxidoreductase [Micromonosporaceae bacterium]|nr:NAD(P)/FAD-dependent oxidoreductase [Micromonosporaceae bacterium]
MVDRVDVCVIGLGVGGEEVGGRLAEAGLTVLGVEERLVGGECPYWGCIPSKMMVRAAGLLAEGRRIDGRAGHAEVRPDWAPVARRIRDEATDNWNDQVAVDRFTGRGGHFLRGRAELVGPGRVAVGDTVVEATRGIVISVGTAPVVPPIDGLAGTPYWTNREAIEAEELPASMIILGGGAIGLELGQVYARFGVTVTVVEALDRLLALEEPESSALAARVLGGDGVRIRTGVKAAGVHHDGTAFTVALSDGSDVTAERLLVATGRRPNFGSLGLAAVGLDPNARAIAVDERMRAADGIWAVGDITGKGAFTHVAMYQAGIAIRDILGQDGPPADYRALPRVTFIDPEIGAVGLTEEQARSHGLTVRVGSSPLAQSTRGWIHETGGEGFIKLVADSDRGVLVGATSAGPMGGEVLAGLAVAIHGEVPVERLRHMIYAYPTFHRATEAALRDLTAN